MPTLTDCLKTIVGLSATDCPCFDTGKPVDYNASLSGRFVTAPDFPLQWSNSATDCESGGLWDLVEQARNMAVIEFVNDMGGVLANRYEKPFVPFMGWVGGVKYNSAKTVFTNGNWIGYKIVPHQIKGGKIVLKGVELILKNIASTTVTVYVYSNLDLVNPIDSVDVTIGLPDLVYSADFASPVVLDISDRDANGYTFNDPYLEYYVVYQLPSGARYINNNISDACCGNKTSSRQNPFLNYGQFWGIEATSPATFETPRNLDGEAKGLRLKADFGCDGTTWLCQIQYDIAAVSMGMHKEYASVVAQAIWLNSRKNLASSILASGNINSITVWSTERLMGNYNHYKAKYSEALLWLSKNFPTDLSDCYACKQTISTGFISTR
jgi:hypothetical protein